MVLLFAPLFVHSNPLGSKYETINYHNHWKRPLSNCFHQLQLETHCTKNEVFHQVFLQ